MPVMNLRIAVTLLLLAVGGSGCATSQPGATSPQGQWLAEEIGGDAVAGDVQTILALGDDGTASGSGGCNRYSGQAAIEGGSIVIGPVAATKMACAPGPMGQETMFFEALDKARSWKIEDGNLLLFDGQGRILVRLGRMGENAAGTTCRVG